MATPSHAVSTCGAFLIHAAAPLVIADNTTGICVDQSESTTLGQYY